ncbi:hypothetical protein Ddc_05345 [Ditylenchus destructor]|nr:hypothetical protein Ddc_05345 [Ditylenchus destructor]
MGNVIYGEKLSCYENMETCSKACARFECIYVDKCGDASSTAHYVCLPFDTRFLMWVLVAAFLIVVLSCSALVACYAIRAIRASFRHALVTENDIVFYNASNVHAFPHPAGQIHPQTNPYQQTAPYGQQKYPQKY